MKKKGVEKEVIVLANNDVFLRLVAEFGACMASSVRKRFPAGSRRFENGAVSYMIRILKTNNVLNSLLI